MRLSRSVVTITPAMLEALSVGAQNLTNGISSHNVWPVYSITLAPAPGAGMLLIPMNISFVYSYGTVPFTISTNNGFGMQLGNCQASQSWVDAMNPTLLNTLLSRSSGIQQYPYLMDLTSTTMDVRNLPYIFYLVDGTISEGNGILTATTDYLIYPISDFNGT